MKRSIRWTVLMAVLGFILGLGFLVTVDSSARSPASDERFSPNQVLLEPVMIEPVLENDDSPIGTLEQALEADTSGDTRANVLFDIHTVSKSKYAKDTDAYVIVRYTTAQQTEISRLSYCSNYNYSAQRADTTRDRYASSGAKAFNCKKLELTDLAKGVTLVKTPLGNALTLRSSNFDPRSGGTISIIFAYRINKVFSNDYRKSDLTLHLANGVSTISGPGKERFDWLNLRMSEDAFGLPNGIQGIDLYEDGRQVSTREGKSFPKSSMP